MIYLSLFLNFFKIGAFTFGGGYAMLPLIQETVLANGWLSKEQLVDFIAVSESTPGPFAVNISTYIGFRTGGIPGALCATLGVVLPSFLIILLVARCYARFRKNRIVNGCMEGLRPAVIGLIGAAVLSVGSSTFDFSALLSLKNLLLLVILIIAGWMSWKKLHPIWIICVSGMLGVLGGMLL
ncbi:MAG: chromate transporter [Lachnospiraceae bacterium]|nr:chromate transporter [Lachnospiraceae bacterium]